MTAHDFGFVEQLSGPNRERRPAVTAYIKTSDPDRVLAPTNRVLTPTNDNTFGYGRLTAISRPHRKTEALLRSTVGPLFTIAAVAVTLTHLPTSELPVGVADHTLRHFPR